MPFDQKLAAQAAKLGKPLAEAGKASKTMGAIGDLVKHLCFITQDEADGGKVRKRGKSGASLMSKFADLKGLMPRKPAKS